MKLLIVDDEALARERLAALLSEQPDCEVVGQAGNGKEAVELAASLQVDALLLDIAMPLMDGLEAARHLSQLQPAPAVIFCTAYDDRALEAFDVAAVDYLVKPVRPERLADALERARRQRAGTRPAPVLPPPDRQRSHLSARLRGSLRLIPVEDIVHLQAHDE